MTDEIEKTETPKMTAAERMAKARAARDANRAAQAVLDDNVVEAPSRTRPVARTRSDGRLEVTGHNGEILSRTRTQVGDSFEVPKSLWPVGWSYQWNSISVNGDSECVRETNNHMHLNGWRAVPAERDAGVLMPKGAKGSIIRGQQLLMERPTVLNDEALAEDVRNAKQLIADRNESLKLAGVKKGMPDGFSLSDRASGVRIQIDKSLDVVNVNRQAGDYSLDE
jgi:hypothetical protein